jgi:hypothetical protein
MQVRSTASTRSRALNCVPDLAEAARRIAQRLSPGGIFVASIIGRICPWEMALYGLRRDWRRLRVRFASGFVPVPFYGRTVWTRYYKPAEFERSFAEAGFERVALRPRTFVPPPYLTVSRCGTAISAGPREGRRPHRLRSGPPAMGRPLPHRHEKAVIVLYNPISTTPGKQPLPLSLMSLAAVLEGRESFRLVDGNLEPDPAAAIVEILRDTRGDVVRLLAATVMAGPQLTQAVSVSKRVRESLPGVPIVWALLPTQHGDTVLKSGPSTSWSAAGEMASSTPRSPPIGRVVPSVGNLSWKDDRASTRTASTADAARRASGFAPITAWP